MSCLLSAACHSRQSAHELQESAGADSREHRQLCKQLAAALCSLAEMKVALAEDVSAVSEIGLRVGCFLLLWGGGGGNAGRQACVAGRAVANGLQPQQAV